MENNLSCNKFLCKECGKTVKVNNFDDIVRFEKKCADCRVSDLTGGVAEKTKRFKKKPEVKDKFFFKKSNTIKDTDFIKNDKDPFRNLRRETKKKIKPNYKQAKIAEARKMRDKIRWDEKWDRECEGRRNYEK